MTQKDLLRFAGALNIYIFFPNQFPANKKVLLDKKLSNSGDDGIF